jgi:hypothetical protein
MSVAPITSLGTRFDAVFANATKRPSAEIESEVRLSPFACAPLEATLARCVTCALTAADETATQANDATVTQEMEMRTKFSFGSGVRAARAVGNPKLPLQKCDRSTNLRRARTSSSAAAQSSTGFSRELRPQSDREAAEQFCGARRAWHRARNPDRQAAAAT